ncbi:Gfo/Idh/MocA family protein [Anaeromicrobium sediminis]|uniref:Oxidoreductase n=1 Tax=Anaeromicrobium sediminis TaxID=1478221 RepID=A0A267MK36_9FIRM|nr:Gfo/Idh/MocA family oxidoreductase [Anaeromicrobium sediminis]PAB59150.1 hypothetical protein CCE28_11570 [Anaeromicrobium sediminis]
MILKTAIIGMGKMGRIRKKELDLHPGFEVVAICDVNESVRKDFPNIQFHKNWEDALNTNLDVVIVCTFNNIIPDIVCSALEKGLHVFSEKPPGRSIDDVKRMIEAEKKAKNQIIKFGFNHRFHYAIMETKSIIDSGRYGKILWARGIYGKSGGENFESSWRSNRKLVGGGILLDQGIHMLDLLRYFLGDFSEVKSFVENCYWKNIELEDNVFALLKTSDNKFAMLHSSATHWKHKFSLDIFLENGYICVNGILSSTRSYGEESITFAKKQFESEVNAIGKPREETIYFDKDDSWRLEIEEFYDCIIGEKRLTSGTTKDALKAMELIDKLYKVEK